MKTFEEWIKEKHPELIDEGMFDGAAKWGRGLAAGAALVGSMGYNAAANDNMPSSQTTAPNAAQFLQGNSNYHWNGEIGRYQAGTNQQGQTVYTTKNGKFLRVPDNLSSTGFKFVKTR